MRLKAARDGRRKAREETHRSPSVVPRLIATALTILEVGAISSLAGWGKFSKPRTIESARNREPVAFVNLAAPSVRSAPRQLSSTSRGVGRVRKAVNESSTLVAPVLIDSMATSGEGRSAAKEMETVLTSDTTVRLHRAGPDCVVGPCTSAIMLGAFNESSRTVLERSSLRYSLMRDITKAPKLPPLPVPPGTLPPPSGIQVGLWGGGPSAKQRKRDSTIRAQMKIVILRMKLRADSIAKARSDTTIRAAQDSTLR